MAHDFPLENGATLKLVAAFARRHAYSPAIKIGERWSVDEVVALDWMRQALEAGFDVGRPRDVRRR